MSRKDKCEEERHNAWNKSENIQQRINELEKVASKYPEFMTPLSDIAVSYLDAGDREKAVKTYQIIIDKKDTFEFILDNYVGKAYLFTGDYAKAIETLKKSNVISYDQGLFLSVSYLKNGNKKEAKKKFDKWISDDLEKSFSQYNYTKYLETLLDDEEKSFIENIWNEYYEKYSCMEPYQLYCKLYKQYFLLTEPHADFEDDDFEIPPKFSKNKFEELKSEYLYLDRKSMFGDMSDSEYERFFELRDLLFAEIIL